MSTCPAAVPDGLILDVEGAHTPGDWLTQWAPAAVEFGRGSLDEMDAHYDGAVVAVYEWDDLMIAGELQEVDLPPVEVLALATRTAIRLLSELGWTEPSSS